MARRTALVGAVLGLTVAATLVAGGAGPRAAAVEDPSAAIDTYLQSAMDESGIPGLAVAVVRDGMPVHVAAFGVAGPDGRPMTTRTPVVIGSVGKSITALAIRQLAAAGRVDLAAPLRRYVPWFSLAASTDEVNAVTIRSLLSHTSGLSTADGQDPRWYTPSMTGEAIARGLATVRPDRPAGTYEYSNLNYVLLGVVVEAVSGQPYGAYVAEHVFGPLAMRDSATSLEPGVTAGLATGHRYLFGVPVAWNEPYPQGIVPAGYQISTAEDMARFVAALATGGTSGGTDIVTGAPPATTPPVLGTDWQPLAVSDPGVSISQSGTTLTSNADILVMPSRGLGIVVLLNANPTQLLGLPRGAADMALDVLRLDLGLLPASTAPTVRSVYLVVDALLALLVLLLAVHAWRARSWPERFRSGRHRRSLVARTSVADLVLPLLVLVGLPLAIGATGSTRAGDLPGGWAFLLWTLPDIGVAVLALAPWRWRSGPGSCGPRDRGRRRLP